MYVLVREDLTPGQQLAQSIHAAVELAQRQDVPDTVVVLAVPDEVHLTAASTGDGVLFREPDLGGEATAYATVSDGRPFPSLRLAGGTM